MPSVKRAILRNAKSSHVKALSSSPLSVVVASLAICKDADRFRSVRHASTTFDTRLQTSIGAESAMVAAAAAAAAPRRRRRRRGRGAALAPLPLTNSSREPQAATSATNSLYVFSICAQLSACFDIPTARCRRSSSVPTPFCFFFSPSSTFRTQIYDWQTLAHS